MDEKVTVKYTGIGFSGLLQIVFIVLKLLDKINWSWFWVFSPSWISFGICIICIIIYLLIRWFLTK